MKRLSRLLAALLAVAYFLSPAHSLAAEGLFRVPSSVTQIESQAFSDVVFPNGLFIPETCASIAQDAFSSPETMNIYGFKDSAAEAYAKENSAVFHAVDIENVSVSAPVWASCDRPVALSVDYTCPTETTVRFEITKDGQIVHTTPSSEEKTAAYTFRDGGAYTVTAIIESPYETVRHTHAAPVVIAERIKTASDVFYLAVGESAALISDEETRTVHLSSVSGSGLSASGTTVTAKALGEYIVTVFTETADGTVYTDIPVEVIIPASDVSITGERAYVLTDHSIQMTAIVHPQNATYQTVEWSVDNEELAQINQDGLLTGRKKGTVVVYATSGNISGACEVRVETPVSSLEITSSDKPGILTSGMRFTLTASANPEGAYNPSCSFESLTPDICRVDSFTGVVTCLKEGTGRIRASANDLGGATGEYEFTVLTGVSAVSFKSVPGLMSANESIQLEVSVLPENAPDKSVEFTSSDDTIVTVSAAGLVTAYRPGSARITAKANNGCEASFSITVTTPVDSVTSALDTLYLNPGMTADPIGSFVFVKPETATDSSLKWSSDNEQIASVNKNTGKITAVANGTCTITATSHNGKTVSFKVSVVSDQPVIKKLSINHTYGALNIGNTATLQPKVDVNNKYTSGTWYSDHPEVLDVVFVDSSNQATVKALSAGTCTIYAISSSGISVTCTIVVNPIIVTDVLLNASSITLNVGDTFPLVASFTPQNATATRLTWTSSNEKVAVTDEGGLITALSGGTTVITAATEDGVTAACRVTVSTVKMTDAKMVEEEITVNAGGTGYPAYTVEPENATPANFYWQSSDKNVVSIDSLTGEMHYLKAGSAEITASALDGSALTLSMTVNVYEIPVTSFTANTEKITLLPGESFHLHTRVLPVNASHANQTFASGDETIAAVSPDGVVTAISKGSTEITVTVGRDDYLHTLHIPVTVEKLDDVTYRALIMGQFTVPATDGYLPFANNSTKGFTDAISRSSIDGNRYQITRIAGSPTPGAIRSALSRLADQADENDVTVIFFLTHGSNAGNEGYVMQTNSGVVIESIDMINALKEISGNVVFVLCTCHSGRILYTSGAKALKNAGGSYTGRNGAGHLSILCSSTSTNSSYYKVNDERLSYDFYTCSVTRGLGWDMLNDVSASSLPADANGDGKVTVSELASYSRGATQRAISSFIQKNGTADFSGHAAQFPSWQIAGGHEDLVIFEK